MSIYVTLRPMIKSALDSDYKQLGFQRTEEVTTTTIRDDCSEQSSGTLTVTHGDPAQLLPFGGVATGKILYLETDQELLVRLNGIATAIKLTPTTGKKAKWMIEGEFTSCSVENVSLTTDAILTYFVAG